MTARETTDAALAAERADADFIIAELERDLDAAREARDTAQQRLLEVSGDLMELRVTLSERDLQIAALEARIRELENPTPVAVPLIGRSVSKYDHGALAKADLLRCYSFGAVFDDVRTAEAKRVYLSDEPLNPSPARLRTELQSLLSAFPGLEIVWLPENEITANNLTSSQVAAYRTKSEGHAAVTEEFATVRAGINITQYGVRVGRHAAVMEACAPHLEIVTSSVYNPGRNKRNAQGQPAPVYDDPDYLEEIIDVCVEYDVLVFGAGEFGTPVMPGQPGLRGDYLVSCVMKMDAYCTEVGVEFDGAAVWDSWKGEDPVNPDNRLLNDNALGAASTASRLKYALTP